MKTLILLNTFCAVWFKITASRTIETVSFDIFTQSDQLEFRYLKPGASNIRTRAVHLSLLQCAKLCAVFENCYLLFLDNADGCVFGFDSLENLDGDWIEVDEVTNQQKISKKLRLKSPSLHNKFMICSINVKIKIV